MLVLGNISAICVSHVCSLFCAFVWDWRGKYCCSPLSDLEDNALVIQAHAPHIQRITAVDR